MNPELESFISGLPKPFSLGREYQEADFYGASKVIADALGLSKVPPCFSSWEHGWLGCGDVWKHEGWLESFESVTRSGLRKPFIEAPRLTYSESNSEEIRRLGGYAETVGLPYCYVPAHENVRMKNSLLIMPPHILPGGNGYDISQAFKEQYIEFLEKIKGNFETVVTCVSGNCMNEGVWLPEMEKAGIEVIKGAEGSDANSLERMSYIFGSFETMTTPVIGSHVVYAAASGCKVSLSGPDPLLEESFLSGLRSVAAYKNSEFKDYCFSLNARAAVSEKFPFLMSGIESAESCEEWAKNEIGWSHKRSPDEIAKLFGWRLDGDGPISKSTYFGDLKTHYSKIEAEGWFNRAPGGIKGALLKVRRRAGVYKRRAQEVIIERKQSRSLSQGESWRCWVREFGALISKADFNLLSRAGEDGSAGQITLSGKPLRYTKPDSCLSMIREIWGSGNYEFSSNGPPRIVDCGANIGLAIRYWSTVFSAAEVTAVEADPEIFKVLQHNVKSWDLDEGFQVDILQGCVSHLDGSVEFKADGSWGGRVVSRGNDEKQIEGTVELTTISLSSLIRGPVDLLKVDIEGSEGEVLWQCRDLIARHVERIFVEWHSFNGEVQNLGRFLTFCEENGYRYHIREALPRESPFTNRREEWAMDSQLDCFIFRPESV